MCKFTEKVNSGWLYSVTNTALTCRTLQKSGIWLFAILTLRMDVMSLNLMSRLFSKWPWDKSLESEFFPIYLGKSIQNRNLACFVCYLKIISLSKNNIHLGANCLKTQTWHYNFSRPSDSWVTDQNNFCMFWSITHQSAYNVAYIDNNNCAPSFLRSLCEIGGDCFGPRYFSEGAQFPKKNTEVQNNRRRIHTMTETKVVQSYYCH